VGSNFWLSHKKEKSPLTQGLNYRSACDNSVDDNNITAVQFKIEHFHFFTSLNNSLIIFIRTYTINHRNALDRLCVRMNITLFVEHLLKRCSSLLLLFYYAGECYDKSQNLCYRTKMCFETMSKRRKVYRRSSSLFIQVQLYS